MAKRHFWIFKILVFLDTTTQINSVSNFKHKMCILINKTNNNFNENFNIKLNKSSNQIESKYNDFCNFSNKKAGNVIESTPNFEMDLKEPASTEIIKMGSIKTNLSP